MKDSEFAETFEWESEAQRKGFLSLLLYLKRIDPLAFAESKLRVVVCWFIQKDHEANEWYNARIGDLDSKITGELKRLTEENRELRFDVEDALCDIAALDDKNKQIVSELNTLRLKVFPTESSTPKDLPKP